MSPCGSSAAATTGAYVARRISARLWEVSQLPGEKCQFEDQATCGHDRDPLLPDVLKIGTHAS